MILPEKILSYIGQGENPDLSFLVSESDKRIDESFGIQYLAGEDPITSDDEPIYRGLTQEALLTSYLDYHQIFNDMQKGQTLVDLGAGYCRGSLLAANDSYNIKCISIEVAKSRAQFAINYLAGQNIILGDLTDQNFEIPKCHAMFIYIPTGLILNKILEKFIYNGTEGATLYVIESHGDFIDNLRFYQDMLFEEVSLMKTSIQRHDPKIYKFKLIGLDRVREKMDNIQKSDYYEKILLPYWLLKYSEVDTIVKVQSKVVGSSTPRFWKANLKNSQLTRYNGEYALQLQSPNRILQLDTQDKIIPE